MIKRSLGVFTLLAGSLVPLVSPTAALARDYDRDYRYGNYGSMSARERREYDKRLRKQEREARREWERAQRDRARSGYYNPYYRTNPAYRDGYYDRNGIFHPYRR